MTNNEAIEGQIVTSIESKLERLAELRKQEAALKPIKAEIDERKFEIIAEIDELKFEIVIDMQRTKSKRTEPVAGIYAIRASRTTVHVMNAELVSDWLENNMFDTSEYYKLDETRIKALADEKLKETGEIVPGLEATETEYITIKEAKS
jgi:hypothetical protein